MNLHVTKINKDIYVRYRVTEPYDLLIDIPEDHYITFIYNIIIIILWISIIGSIETWTREQIN